MLLSEYKLKYGEFSAFYNKFFIECKNKLERGELPTPAYLTRVVRYNSLGKLNGIESRIRINLLIEYGYEKITGRWGKKI